MRIISNRFHIILTGYLTEMAPVRKVSAVHTSEISKKFTEMLVRITILMVLTRPY